MGRQKSTKESELEMMSNYDERKIIGQKSSKDVVVAHDSPAWYSI